MKNCVLTCFVYSALMIGCSREELVQDSITVYPRVLEDREGNSEKILLIRDGHSLKLTKASVLSERVSLQYGTNDGVINRYIDGKYYERHLYQDSEKQAALLVRPQVAGDYHISGLVNASHMIEPLTTSERSLSGGTPHKLSRLNLLKRSLDMTKRTRSPRRKIPWYLKKEPPLKVPKNFTIEMVFISDSTHSEMFDNASEHIDYVIVFMLGASLRLQQLNPPGSIALTSIRRLGTEEDNIYLSLSKDDRLVAMETMKKIGNHAIFDHELYDADAVYLTTLRDIKQYEDPRKKRDLFGMAMIGGICSYDKSAVGKDEPFSYSGLSIFIHELGHLLNLHHDGERDSSHCRPKAGYIMHTYFDGEHHYEWSKCSNDAIRTFLQSPKSSCLHSVKSRNVSLLPNDHMNLTSVINGADYCDKYFPNFYDVSHEKVSFGDNCYFRCKLKMINRGPHYAHIRAPDGTPCKGRTKKCYKGICR
ncbi:venom metalloproteinase 3-like [Dermacentor albipictus]|uniref:venom metalloproteinase 3-like n=1 Tax=Dermacentor albipictus TaxID=60249 RepID=UPI0038FBF2E6